MLIMFHKKTIILRLAGGVQELTQYTMFIKLIAWLEIVESENLRHFKHFKF